MPNDEIPNDEARLESNLAAIPKLRDRCGPLLAVSLVVLLAAVGGRIDKDYEQDHE